MAEMPMRRWVVKADTLVPVASLTALQQVSDEATGVSQAVYTWYSWLHPTPIM